MPVYEFMDDEGTLHEQHMPMSSAPRIGEVATLENGITATRIVSMPETGSDNWQPYISNRLPRFLEGAKHTPGGKPIIESRSQEREIAAKHGLERE